MKNCFNCKREIPLDSLLCPYCGVQQSVPEAAAPPLPISVTKSKKGAFAAAVIRNAAILTVAILLLVGSFFPISRSTFMSSPLANEDMRFSLNAFQYVTLFFDSFKDWSAEEAEEEFSEDLYELVEALGDLTDVDWDDLSFEEQQLVNKVFYYYLRATTTMDDEGPSVSLTCSAAFGIINILLCVALFVVALLNFLATFNLIGRGKNQLYTWTLALLTASPVVILATHYVNHLAIGGELSPLAIWSLVCAAAVIILTMVFRYVFSKKDSSRNILARSVALGLSVLIFGLAFAPVFSANFKSEANSSFPSYSRKVKVPHGAEFFEQLVVGDTQAESIEQLRQMSKESKKTYFEGQLDIFSSLSKKEIASDYGANLNAELLVSLIGAKVKLHAVNALSITTIFFVLTTISALLLLWQSLYFFASGKHFQKVVFTAKICAVIAATIALILTILLLGIAASYTTTYISSTYKVTIEAGVILSLIASFGALFCPTSLTKKEKKIKLPKPEIFREDLDAQF